MDFTDSPIGIVTHKSGAQCSHHSPFNFFNRFESVKLTCERFKHGNVKYEGSDTVYANMNWLKAFAEKDVEFFRDRAGHALEHFIAEMHGDDDNAPGGNLGAVGWCLEVLAYVKKLDPVFYAAIQGKAKLEPEKAPCVGIGPEFRYNALTGRHEPV